MEAIELMRGLEFMRHKERLGEQGLLSRQKGRGRWYLIAV